MKPVTFLPMFDVLCRNELWEIIKAYGLADHFDYRQNLEASFADILINGMIQAVKIYFVNDDGKWESIMIEPIPHRRNYFLILKTLRERKNLHYLLDIPKVLKLSEKDQKHIENHLGRINLYLRTYDEMEQIFKETMHYLESEKQTCRRDVIIQQQRECDLKLVMQVSKLWNGEMQEVIFKNNQELSAELQILKLDHLNNKILKQKVVKLETEKSSRYKDRRENRDKRLTEYIDSKESCPSISDREIYAEWIREDNPKVKPKTAEYEALVHKWVVWKSRLVKKGLLEKKVCQKCP